MELKLPQEFSRMEKDPLFIFFLHMRKAYDMIDRGCIIRTLEGYGAGPHTCDTLEIFWYHQEVIMRQNGYHGTNFKDTQGKTQGGIISPTQFNVVVDNVVRMWLEMNAKDQAVAQEGLRLNVGRCLGVFYANYGMVGACDSEWLQKALNIPIGFFRRYGIIANAEKSRTIMCQPEALRLGMLEEAAGQRCTGVGAS